MTIANNTTYDGSLCAPAKTLIFPRNLTSYGLRLRYKSHESKPYQYVLVPGTGGDLDSIGEMVVDTDELEENEDAPSEPKPIDDKNEGVAMCVLQGFGFR